MPGREYAKQRQGKSKAVHTAQGRTKKCYGKGKTKQDKDKAG